MVSLNAGQCTYFGESANSNFDSTSDSTTLSRRRYGHPHQRECTYEGPCRRLLCRWQTCQDQTCRNWDPRQQDPGEPVQLGFWCWFLLECWGCRFLGRSELLVPQTLLEGTGEGSPASPLLSAQGWLQLYSNLFLAPMPFDQWNAKVGGDLPPRIGFKKKNCTVSFHRWYVCQVKDKYLVDCVYNRHTISTSTACQILLVSLDKHPIAQSEHGTAIQGVKQEASSTMQQWLRLFHALRSRCSCSCRWWNPQASVKRSGGL